MAGNLIPLEEFGGQISGSPAGLVPLEEFGGQSQEATPAAYAYRVMQAHGWSAEQAAGIVGNLLHESGGLNPQALGDGGASYGLAQWNGERRQALEEFARSRGTGPEDFNTQLDFVNHELQGSQAAAGQKLAQAKTVEEATRVFSELFERPGVPRMDSRLAQARGVYDPQGAGYVQQEKVMSGLDLAPGMAQAGPRTATPPGLYAEQPSILDTVKDYLGYRDLPQYLPMLNQETGQWEAKNLYEARRLYRGWDEPTELERVAARGYAALTFGLSDFMAEVPIGPPQTTAGAIAGGALELAGFLTQPMNLSELAWGSRLAPTRTGLRGVAQLMAQSGATLGTATALASLIPSFANSENLTEGTYNFIKSTASSTLVGALYPVLGANTGRPISTAVRAAAGLAVLDFLQTRFQPAPDKGLFTIDDVVRGALDGSINKAELARKTFGYLMDLYFLAKTPNLGRSLAALKTNAVMAEAAKINPQEAEDALVQIGQANRQAGGTFKFQQFPLQESRQYEARFLAEVKRVAPELTEAQGRELLQDPEAFQKWQSETKAGPEEVARLKEAAAAAKEGAAGIKAGPEGEATSPEKAGSEAGAVEPDRNQALWEQAQKIEVGDPIRDGNLPQIGGFVRQEVTQGKGDTAIPGYLVDYQGKSHFIAREAAELMGGPEGKYAELLSAAGPGMAKGGETPPLPGEAAKAAAGGTPAAMGAAAGGEPVKETTAPLKEPWELSKAEVIQQAREQGFSEISAEKQHEAAIDYALGQGVEVKPEIIRDYPALAQKYGMAPYKLFSGGPGTEELTDYAKGLVGLGKKMIDWADKRLERSLPPDLKDPDASKVVGSLLLKIQQFEDLAQTYPEARPMFEAARAGLALKMRRAQEFYSLMAAYSGTLNPAERARVDKVLVKLDEMNDPSFGREPQFGFRLGEDLNKWAALLENGDPQRRDLGIAAYQRISLEYGGGGHLTEKEAAAAYGVRMALDYAKALHMDGHTRAFQDWLQGHGFEPAKIQDFIDLTLHGNMKPEDLAKAYFGPEPGKNITQAIEHFRDAMQYWLKETNQYIPHSRYGEYFLRVVDTSPDRPENDFARKFLKEIENRFPGGLEAARDTANWQRTPAGRLRVPKGLDLSYRELRRVIKEVQPGSKVPHGPALVEAALKLSREVVHATAAESRAQYHEKRAALEAEFPAPRYAIQESLNKQLPMELFAETHIPRIWKIVSEAAESGKMPRGAGEAMVEAWQDFLAAKGFGAHFIRRANIPGYETDLMRPLNDYLAGLAGYLGKMEKIRGYSDALAGVPRTMPNLMRHLNEYANYTLSNPKEYEGIRSLIYNFTLGGNFSFHFINAMQNLHTGWAVLGQEGGTPLRELAGVYKDWSKYLTTGEGLREGEAAVLARARYEPELAPSGVGELSGRAYNPLYRWLHNDPTSLANKGLDIFKEIWGGSFVEKMNRETMFLAAYRTTGDFDRSIELVRQAHFLYGKETRPSLARGAGSIPFIFMTFTVNYFSLLKNFSKAALGINPEVYGSRAQGAQGLARMAAGALMTGGMMSTFLGPLVSWAWQKVFGANLEEDGRRWWQQTMGLSPEKAAFMERLVWRGPLAAALGIDIGSRIAPNLPFGNLASENDLTWEKVVGAALGAGSLPLQKLFQVGKALSHGEVERALEAATPTSISNLLQSYRGASEGYRTLTGRPMVDAQGKPLQLDWPEAVAKGLGFQPVHLAERRAQEDYARAMEADRSSRVQDYAGRIAKGVQYHDEAGARAAIQEVVAYNNKLMKAGRLADLITPEALQAAIMARFKPKYPDVSQQKMILRQAGPSLADTLTGGAQ